MELAEGARRLRRRPRARAARKRELKVLERDTTKLETGQGAVPAHLVRRGGEDAEGEGAAVRVGRRLRRPDETALSEQFDRPVCVHRYPSAVKAFYMKPDPERPEVALVRRRARARRLRRDHRRRRAPRRLRPAARSASRSTTCRRKRSSGISTCAATAGAARRLRHGHRARRRLDLRPRAPARDDSVSADAVPDVSVSGSVQ